MKRNIGFIFLVCLSASLFVSDNCSASDCYCDSLTVYYSASVGNQLHASYIATMGDAAGMSGASIWADDEVTAGYIATTGAAAGMYGASIWADDEVNAAYMSTGYITSEDYDGISYSMIGDFCDGVDECLSKRESLLDTSYVRDNVMLSGGGQLENGQCVIKLDPAFLEKTVIDTDNPMRVFVTLTDVKCNGLAVVNKEADSFTVEEINNNGSGATFDWQVMAKAK